jgi:hypothetical protein
MIDWGLTPKTHSAVMEDEDRVLANMPWNNPLQGEVFRSWAAQECPEAIPLLDVEIAFEGCFKTPTMAQLGVMADALDRYAVAGGEQLDTSVMWAAYSGAKEQESLDERVDLTPYITPFSAYHHQVWNATYGAFLKRLKEYRAANADQDAEGLVIGYEGEILDGDYAWSSDENGLMYVFDRSDPTRTLATIEGGVPSAIGTISIDAGVPGTPVQGASAEAGTTLAAYTIDWAAIDRTNAEALKTLVTSGSQRRTQFMLSGELVLIGHHDFGAVRELERRRTEEGVAISQGTLGFHRNRTSPNEFLVDWSDGPAEDAALTGEVRRLIRSTDTYPYRDRERVVFR